MVKLNIFLELLKNSICSTQFSDDINDPGKKFNESMIQNLVYDTMRIINGISLNGRRCDLPGIPDIIVWLGQSKVVTEIKASYSRQIVKGYEQALGYIGFLDKQKNTLIILDFYRVNKIINFSASCIIFDERNLRGICLHKYDNVIIVFDDEISPAN